MVVLRGIADSDAINIATSNKIMKGENGIQMATFNCR
jgi:hypothetical protein